MKTCKTCELENYPCDHRKNYGIFGWTIGCENNWRPKPNKKILKALEEEKTAVRKSYSSTEEMIKEMDAEIAKEKKERPIYYYGTRFYYRWIERPAQSVYYFIKCEIPHWFKYGYSRKDIWSLDYTLAKWIIPRLKELKECKAGIPCCVVPEDAKLDETGNPTQEEWDKAEKLWAEYLNKMIRAFEIMISDEDDMYDNASVKAEYEEGIELFKTYLRSLWT